LTIALTVILAALVFTNSLQAQTIINSMTIGTQPVATYGTAGPVIIPVAFTISGSGAGSATINIIWTAPTGVTTSLPTTIDLLTFTSPIQITITTTTGTPAGTTGYMLEAKNGATTTAQQLGSFVVAQKALTITGLTGVNKVYDGTLTGSLSGTPVLNTVLAGDVANVTLGGTPVVNFATAPVGTAIALTVSGYSLSGTAAVNYSVIQPTGLSANITAKTITLATPAAVTKVYDGTNAATITGTLTGVVSPDVVTLNGTGTFAFVNLGTGIAVTSTSILAGAQAGNYTLTQPTGLTANITAKPLTLTSPVAADKVYDKTNPTTITGTLTGIVGTEVVVLHGTGTFASVDAGTGIAVTSTSTIDGAGAGNYSLVQPTGLIANITPKPLTITGLRGTNKAYDGTLAGLFTGAPVMNTVLAADVANVTLGGNPVANFATAAPGVSKPLTVSGYTLSGTASGNYSVVQPVLTAIIFQKELTVVTPVVVSRPYDGTAAVTITGTLTGRVGTENVSLVGSGILADVNAGPAVTVTSDCSLTGTDVSNYYLTQPTGLTANITPKALTVTATGPAKVYGTALTAGVSSTNFTTTALVGNQTIASVILTPNNEGLIAITPAGSAYQVTPSQATGAAGFLSANYSITYVAFSGIVDRKPITVTANAGQRKLIGTSDPVLTYTYAPALVGTDVFSGALARAAGETVEGSPYAITIGTLSAGTNYSLTLVSAGFTITSTAEALITAFNFTSLPKYSEVIVQSTGAITVPVKYSANLTSMVATFTASPGAIVRMGGAVQTSGVSFNNFSSSVAYVVTSANGAVTKTYTVTATRNAVLTGNQLTAFEFPDLPGSVGTISETDKSVTVRVPLTMDVKNLVAKFTISDAAIAYIGGNIQTSGVTASDYTAALTTNGLTFSILSENGVYNNYFIKFVRDAARTGNQLLTFSVSGVAGAINDLNHTVMVRIPVVIDIAHAVATFTSSYMSAVKIGTVLQTSKVTVNNFLSPVIYSVVSESGVILDYTVTVVVDQGAAAKDFIYFAFEDFNPDVICTINTTNLTITGSVPNGSSRTSLRAFFATNSPAATVSVVGQGLQQSGLTRNDFTSILVYQVTASDGSTRNFTVTITEAPDTTPPVVTNAAQVVSNLPGQYVILRSNESIGKVYIIKQAASQTTVADLEASVAAKQGKSAYVFAANSDIPISTAGMTEGTYNTYAIDGSGNKSAMGANAIIIQDRIPPVVSVAAQTIINASTKTVDVTSSDNGIVYLIKEGVPQVNKANLDDAIRSNRGAKALVINPNVPTPVSVANLEAGNYHAYAVDFSIYNNVSAPSTNVVVVTEASRIKSILAYSFNQLDPPAIGQIVGTEITVRVRVGTPVTSLVATYIAAPTSEVRVGTKLQVSGVTANDFTSPVLYTVTAEDGSSLVYTVTVEFNTGIEDNSWINSIRSYPNPVSGNLTIETSLPLDHIVILNGNGQVISDIQNPGQTTIQVSTDSWSKGIYFVRYFSEKKYIGIQKIIKN
jgi:hypothetical protein